MITPTDLKQYKSSNPNSDGGGISDVEVVNGESNNLFADIESKLAGTAYRKVFRKNTHKSLTWQNVRSWIVSQPKNALLSFGLSVNHVDADSGDEGNMSPLEGNSVIAIRSDGEDDRKLVLIGEDTDGNHQTEVLNLTGDTDVVGSKVFSKLYGAYVHKISESRTIAIKQGEVIRGNILPATGSSFLWMNADSEEDAMKHGDIDPDESFGLWYRLTWPDGVGAVSANSVWVESRGGTES